MQTLDQDEKQAVKFVQTAIDNADHYGKHGVRAFLLAYHGCVKVKSVKSGNIVPTCFESWDEYNNLIDEKDTMRKVEEE